jgi:hypothetical protein
MIERTGRTVICSIVFMDIVGFSKTLVPDQMAMKALLNGLVRRAVADISESERIVIDTGDGVALCFMGDPEDALFVATAVNDAVRKGAADAPTTTLRTGINLGPVKTVVDLNGQANVLGDGINVAERIMSFAGDNEILISRSYYEVVSCLNERYAKLFHYIGMKKDKHIREHQLYALGALNLSQLEAVCGPAKPAAQAVAAEAAPAARAHGGEAAGEEAGAVAFGADAAGQAAAEEAGLLPEPLLAAEAQRLANLIGPLAKVIVARAAQSADSREKFYQTISSAIPDRADRASFLAKAPPPPRDAEAAFRSAFATTFERPKSPKTPMPPPDLGPTLAPARAPRPPTASPPTASPPAASPLAESEFEGPPPSAEQLAEVERQLTEHLGPLAHLLVHKEAAKAASLDALCAGLAKHIKNKTERERFLEAFRD